MAKLTLNDLVSGYGNQSAYNENNTRIEAAIENTISRDGTAPNAMEADFDMGGYEIQNVGAPTNNNSAARLVDISDSDATGAASATLRSDLGSVATAKGASLIGVEDSAALFAGADVEAVLNEIQDNIDAHIADATAAHAASAVDFTPAGSIAATDVQAALEELDSDRSSIDLVKNVMYIENLSLSASVATNALTIALKTAAGSDASATSPIKVGFRSSTATSGLFNLREIDSAVSLTVSSGSTLGTANATLARLWILLFDTGSGYELGIVNCYSSGNIYYLNDNTLGSTTAEGGAGAADSAGVIYSTTSLTDKPYRILGYIEATETTAGTWDSAPTLVQLHYFGGPLPGDVIQRKYTTYTSLTNTTSVIPSDNTIPQNTEGLEIMTLAITPKSTANILRIKYRALCGQTNGGIAGALFQDSTADALTATQGCAYGTHIGSVSNQYIMRAGTVSSTTFKVRVGPWSAGTLYVNGNGAGTQLYNGVSGTSMYIEEVFV